MRQKNCTMHIYVNTLKKSKITQKYPMYLKLVYNGEKIETRLPKTMDVMESELKFWDKSSSLFSYKKDDPRNIDLMEFRVRFNKYFRLNENRLVDPINVIMAKVLNKPSIDKNWTVLSYCEYFFQNRVKDNIERRKGTKTNYQKAINHLTNFLVKNNLAKLPLESFKHKHAQDFQIYMGSDAQNVASSTTTNIIRLNTIFKEAINEDLITKNPFSQLKLHYKAVNRTPSLTVSQLKDIIQSEGIKKDPKLRFIRDMFLFACFTGLSSIDIHSLSYNALFKIYDNRLKLDTSRQKSGKIIIQILPDCAKRIIERYGLPNHSNQGVVFPSFSDDDFREKLKLIAVHAKINVNLTTKVGRTTCNQLIINTGCFDVIYKRAYFGWSNGGDIQNVYTTITDEILLRNTIAFEVYLQNYLGEQYQNI